LQYEILNPQHDSATQPLTCDKNNTISFNLHYAGDPICRK